MTQYETEVFYNNDKKKYKIQSNKEFLIWYNEQLEKNYKPLLNLREIQELINKLVNWYEIKYPDNVLDESTFKAIIQKCQNPEDISKYLDINQLRYRLSYKELETLDCNYRNTNNVIKKFEKQSKLKKYIVLKLKGKNNYNVELLVKENGIIKKSSITELEPIIGKINKPINLRELINKLNLIKHNLDYSELNKCLKEHKIDLELRNIILNLTQLALIYSKNTIPELGYARAVKFVEEFNNYYDLKLNTDEIDKIISNDYSKPKKSILIRILKNN